MKLGLNGSRKERKTRESEQKEGVEKHASRAKWFEMVFRNRYNQALA